MGNLISFPESLRTPHLDIWSKSYEFFIVTVCRGDISIIMILGSWVCARERSVFVIASSFVLSSIIILACVQICSGGGLIPGAASSARPSFSRG